jgi:two-component system, cell cycle sensor histidine kinase and response regulator CckA
MSVLSQRGQATILLADDEAILRELGETILRQAGYNVVTLYRRDQLAALLKNHHGNIDLLLTDVVMPEFSGQEVANAVRERWPQVKVMYMSGYTPEDIAELERDAGFLQKPFTPTELMERVGAILGAGPS